MDCFNVDRWTFFVYKSLEKELSSIQMNYAHLILKEKLHKTMTIQLTNK
jgi:hypothetical protein